ncbi:MAG: TIGR00375 family protein [Candidatus Hydrothermarchaeales archaeon]
MDCDFHIHSRYSAATSNKMDLETISRQAILKGLSVVGTGDALHSKWLDEIKSLNPYSEGVYELNDCKFVITVEVEDNRRVHHVIFIPDIASAESLRESLAKFSVDMEQDGRPHLRLGGEEIVEHVEEVDGLVGPSHAFVPWTSIYKEYNSLKECYGSKVDKIKFLELGLSADTYLADRISELQDITLLSNSDAHSPWPHRLGREFNRLEISEVSFPAIRKALERKNGHGVVLNVGLDPRLGKYHRTACIKCLTHYNLEEATQLRWRCSECRGILKKGVTDRIEELASYTAPRHPGHRPKYVRIAPLAEILSLALKHQIYSNKIQEAWKKLVTTCGSEIAVLIDAPLEEITITSGEKVAELIKAFREGQFGIIEGGGGKYGKVLFGEKAEKLKRTQTKLDGF